MRAVLSVSCVLAAGCARDPAGQECPELGAGDLVVTEVRGNQTGNDLLKPYVELYNASGHEVDLLGTKIRFRKKDGSGEMPILVRRSVIVAAGGYVVLGLEDDARPVALRRLRLRGRLPRRASSSAAFIDVETCSQLDRSHAVRLAAEDRHLLARHDAAERRRQRPPHELVHRPVDAAAPQQATSHVHEPTLRRLSILVARRPSLPARPSAASATRARSRRSRSPSSSRRASSSASSTLTKIVDGDTIRVDGLDSSLRLLGDDTEETFKNEADRRAFEAGWEQYKKAKRAGLAAPGQVSRRRWASRPRLFAKHFFEGVDKVRIERDHPAEIRDRYNRYLAYVFAQKNGKWINYNIEVVRAGMSPYFPKYGHSRRFHDEFLEARGRGEGRQRGIWEPGAPGYPDYPEREAWWNARGDFVEAVPTRTPRASPSFIDITHWDALKQIEASVGKEVTSSARSATCGSARRARRA